MFLNRTGDRVESYEKRTHDVGTGVSGVRTFLTYMTNNVSDFIIRKNISLYVIFIISW